MITRIRAFNEAYLYQSVVSDILAKLNIDKAKCQKLGEGDNGIAYLYDGKCIKITTDSEEAEFFQTVRGHELQHVANVYDVYEYDTGHGEDNRGTQRYNSSRYYWVIVKEYLPHKFSDPAYYDVLVFFDNYQTTLNFNYSRKDFDRMIKEYMGDYEDLSEDERYEVDDAVQYLEMFAELHEELAPLGIKSVSDMKSSNMGMTADGDIKYLELHIYKVNDRYKEPVIKKL